MSDKPAFLDGERFMRTVSVNEESGCWVWTGNLNKDGYGRICQSGGRMLAHRAAYQIFVGPIPDGGNILHHCDNPACVNPTHLYAGSQKENVRDMIQRNRCAVGSKAGMAKITEQDAVNIFIDRRMDREIAVEYGISIASVARIKCGDSWRHATDNLRRYAQKIDRRTKKFSRRSQNEEISI